MAKIVNIDFSAKPDREWVYDPKAFIPVWVMRAFHKLGNSEQMFSTTFGKIVPGDKVIWKDNNIYVIRKDDGQS